MSCGFANKILEVIDRISPEDQTSVFKTSITEIEQLCIKEKDSHQHKVETD